MTAKEILEGIGDLVSTGSSGAARCAWVDVDGMPILFMGRLSGRPLRREQRAAWIDWFMPQMDRAERNGWRVYYRGAEAKVLERVLTYVRRVRGQDGGHIHMHERQQQRRRPVRSPAPG